MHQFGIIHCDIHFGNILFNTDNNNLILSDYGCSCFSKKFWIDITAVGYCLQRLIDKYFNCNMDRIVLWELESKAAGNKELLSAIELSKIMINYQSTTIDQILNHSFLKRENIKCNNSYNQNNIENVSPNINSNTFK